MEIPAVATLVLCILTWNVFWPVNGILWFWLLYIYLENKMAHWEKIVIRFLYFANNLIIVPAIVLFSGAAYGADATGATIAVYLQFLLVLLLGITILILERKLFTGVATAASAYLRSVLIVLSLMLIPVFKNVLVMWFSVF